MNKKVGKKVDLKGISGEDIEAWLKDQSGYKIFIKCHALISLSRGTPMNIVCDVFSITRESVRRWKGEYRIKGVKGLTESNKKGKTPSIDNKNRVRLIKIVTSSPLKQGYEQKKWTGLLLKKFVHVKWNINITVRTAQVWLKSLK